jgi:hypothetical protein
MRFFQGEGEKQCGDLSQHIGTWSNISVDAVEQDVQEIAGHLRNSSTFAANRSGWSSMMKWN